MSIKNIKRIITAWKPSTFETYKKTFEKYGIYGDITKYFESLHTMGDHCIVQDIDDYISSITGNGLGKA